MKCLYIYFFLVTYTTCIGQGYYSRIIPTSDNPLVKVVEKVGDKYIIPTDFFGNGEVRGGFIVVGQDGDEKVKFENMDLGLSPIL